MSNIQDSISDLRITICTAKAIAEAFGAEFVELSTTERRTTAIEAAPHRHEYLYYALQKLLHEAEQQVIKLDEAG